MTSEQTPSVSEEVERVARAIHDALYQDESSGAWMSGKCPLNSVTIDGEVDLMNGGIVGYKTPAIDPDQWEAA